MDRRQPSGGDTPVKFPRLITANNHSILFLSDPTLHPYLRELETVSDYLFTHNLPDVEKFREYNAELIAVERPGSMDELGRQCTRCWAHSHRDTSARPETLQTAVCVLPDIRPGLPSRPYIPPATA